MIYHRVALRSFFFTAALLFTGCGEMPHLDNTTSSADSFVYRGHNFGENRNVDYQQGVKDGCRTSDGDYTKNHTLFKKENDYRAGWEHGRMHCKGTGE
ncbi:MAG TPA: hypothetical protein ENJ71_03725 [Epsilonproteobacteria bacterium]|nr:hypothetical protein [Campylobacterota bacterium]